MRYILLILPVLLIGCATNEPKQCEDRCIIKVPVYEKPAFEMPTRPELRNTSNLTSDGEVVRSVELNISDLMTYSIKLEELLKSFH